MPGIEMDTDYGRETWREAPPGEPEAGKAQVQCRLCATWMHRLTGYKRGQFRMLVPEFDHEPVLEVAGVPTSGNQVDVWTCSNLGCPSQTEMGGKLWIVMTNPA